mgnify:CR=1 FL=1
MNQPNPDLELGVEFYVKPIENAAKSREEGRPIYDDVEYIKIKFPADSKRTLETRADEMHYVPHAKTQMTYAERFAPSYDAFKREDLSFVSGTPLASTGLFPKAKVAELKALSVVTVEQLAGLPDTNIRKLGMGGRALVDDAKGYLENASGLAEIATLRAEIAALKAGAATQAAPVVSDDPYDGFTDEDLKNMIRDAGAELPKGRTSRSNLVAALEDLSKAKEEA